MKLKIANTTKFLMSRIGASLCVLIISFAATSHAALFGWGEGWYKGPYIGQFIWSFLTFFPMPVLIYLAIVVEITGSVEFVEDDIIIGKINPSLAKYKGKDVFLKKGEPINKIKLAHSNILSIHFLLDSSKKKPIYAREYFKGAENNWLIIKMKDGKEYKIEILLKSLAMEKELIDYLDNLKEKNIQISYGTKRKTILHAIRCAF